VLLGLLATVVCANLASARAGAEGEISGAGVVRVVVEARGEAGGMRWDCRRWASMAAESRAVAWLCRRCSSCTTGMTESDTAWRPRGAGEGSKSAPPPDDSSGTEVRDMRLLPLLPGEIEARLLFAVGER
jgi:hypothetical protein